MAPEHGRDEAIIEDDLSVGTRLDDVRHRNLRKVLGGLALRHQTRIETRHFEVGRHSRIGVDVTRILVAGPEACQLRSLPLASRL